MGLPILATEQYPQGLGPTIPALRERLSQPPAKVTFSCRECGELFEPFRQADASTTRKYGGTGLGLAIANQLVRRMGGVIGAESRPGCGSVFWFRLKARVLSNAGRARTSETGPAAHDAAHLNARILVAEDNPVGQYVVRKHLGKLGCEVDVAENGQMAVELFRKGHYDAILMDCQMPVMDGFEATATIRAEEGRGERVPIIALTANAMPEDQQRCLAAGMDSYISKPLDVNQLIQLLNGIAHDDDAGSTGKRSHGNMGITA